MDEEKLRCLGILITKPWKNIISDYRAIGQILDKKNTSFIDGANNNSNNKNIYAKTGFDTYNIKSINANTSPNNISGMRDVDSTDGVDNNSDGENTYATIDFNTYNIASVNANMNNMSSIRNANKIGGINNNTDSKNAYIKADFSIYNIADMSVDNTTNVKEKVSNNINKTDASQLSKIDRVNKNGLDGTNKGGLDRNNKNGISEANVEAYKKADAGAVTSTDNNTNKNSKVTDWHAGLTSQAFTFLATINYTGNSNFLVSKLTFSGATTFISDKFYVIFTALANITLEKKPNVCEFNLFSFIINRQSELIDNIQVQVDLCTPSCVFFYSFLILPALFLPANKVIYLFLSSILFILLLIKEE